MTNIKRMLALILCAVMLFSAVPFQALAAEAETEETHDHSTDITESPSETPAPELDEDPLEPNAEAAVPQAVSDTDTAKIGDTGYATLADAVAAAQDGDTIVLLKDSSFSTAVTVSKAITITAESAVTVTKTGANEWLLIRSGGNVTLEGPITVVGTSGKYGALIEVASNGILTMNSGVTLKDNKTTESKIAGGVNIVDGTFTMNGGTITNCGSTASIKPGSSDGGTMGGGVNVSLSKSSTVNATFIMNGGTISNCSAYNGGGVGVENLYNSKSCVASFTMNGGSITGCSQSASSANTSGGAAIYIYNKINNKTLNVDGAVVTINGGSITGNTGAKYGTLGIYTGMSGNTYGGKYYILGGYIGGNFVGGGTNNAPSSFYGNGVHLDRLINSAPLLTVGGSAVLDDEVFLKSSNGNYFEILDNFTGSVKVFSQKGGLGNSYGTLVAKAVSSTGVASTATKEIAGKITAVYGQLDDNGKVYEHPGYDVVLGTNPDEYVLGEYAAEEVTQYTVTYTDGVETEEVFADQSYTVDEGSATPAFEGTPSREGYTFTGWTPAVAETVTEDVTYTAIWQKNAAGNIYRAYLRADNGRIYVDLLDVTYNESVALELYSGETLLTTAVLNATEYPGPATKSELTGSICVETYNDSDTWIIAEPWLALDKVVPTEIKLVVDGKVVDVHNVILDSANGETMTEQDWIDFPGTYAIGGEFNGWTWRSDNEGLAVELQNILAFESVAVKVYSGDELLTTVSWRDEYVQKGKYLAGLTCSVRTGEEESTQWAATAWMPIDQVVPTKLELYVDGVLCDTLEITVDAEKWAALTGTVTRPEAPDKYGKNVTPALIRIICDTDEAHAPMDIAWQHQSTKVYPGAQVQWNEELGTWTIDIRIDSISTYYVWEHFEETYNDINHDITPESLTNAEYNRIDTTLKWDEAQQLWVTMDGKPIEVHTTCKTAPTAPRATWHLNKYQIKVTGEVGGEEKNYFIYLDPASITVGEVKGSRETGFSVDVTVPITDGDAYVTGWAEKWAPGESYVYDRTKTPESITFTVYYTRDTSSDLYGDQTGDWALANGNTSGTVGTVYVSKVMVAPPVPEKLGGNVVNPFLTVICDTDDNHADIPAKWYSVSCQVYPTNSVPEWNEDLQAWTIGARIQTIEMIYVNQMEDANNDIIHELVGDSVRVVTLKWDEAQNLWVPTEPVEIHCTCKTIPTAPAYHQMSSYQVQVMGDLDGDGIYGEKATDSQGQIPEMYTTSIPEGCYSIGEVYGSRQEGFFVDVTATLSDGDIFITNWIEQRAPGKSYVYDWTKTEKTITFTLKYAGDLYGTLNGTRSGDWVLSTTGNGFGAVAQAYVTPVTATVQIVIYRNGDVNVPYKTVSLGKIAKGTVIDLNELDIAEYYSYAQGFAFEGWFNDGKWNQYKAGLNPAGLETITVNGWTNIICMVTDYHPVVVRAVTNGDKENAEVIFTGKALKGENLVNWLNANVEIPAKDGYIADKWYNWDWYGHKHADSATVNGWTNVYITYSPITYTIKYNAPDGEYVGSEPNSGDNWMLLKNAYTYDAPVTLHDGTGFRRGGYTLTGWTINGVFYELGETVEVNFTKVQNGTVQAYAVWEVLPLNVYYYVDGELVGSFTVTDENEVMAFNVYDNAYFTAPEKTGYTLIGWYEKAADIGNTAKAEPNTAQNFVGKKVLRLYGAFEANQYTLTLDPNGGKVDPTTVTVTYDAPIGQLPEATRSGYIFDGWVDAQGNKVTAETVYTIAGDSTVTAQWIRHPGSGSGNVTKELFTIQCTLNHDHKWDVNWFGSHVSLVKDSVKWNEELGRWEAQATFKNFYLINSTTTKRNYFGGITHYYEDGQKITMDLYYDPNFTGLNSEGKEVTGMWLPAEKYVANVWCYDKPSMPDVSKITGKALWVRDADYDFRNTAYSTKYTIKQLLAGTYSLSQMYTENGKFYVDLTITDLDAYAKALSEKNGKTYVVGNWADHKTAEDFKFKLVYTGSTTDYKQDGTGWSVDASSYVNTKDKNNGMSLWLTEQFTVTYTDGVNEDQVFVVNAFSENGGTKDDWADFSATATPTVEDPTRANYIFAGWTPEVAETVTESVTYTAQWIQYPGSGSTNVTKELFTIQCTVNHDHAWLCNWFGSHVSLVKDSVKWNEELGRWEAQAKIGSSMMSQINATQPKKNYFGGITHHYDETNYVFDLYYDPNFTGLNSQSKEVTGMWLPVKDYVVDVYCYTEPSMPDISKISTTALWMRDAGNRNATHSQKFTVKNLIEGSYTLGQMYTENGKFYVKLTITDLAPYIQALGEKTGKSYVIGDWQNHLTLKDCVFTLVYTGSTTDYKQDGTGWSVDASSWNNSSEKMNGKSLWLTEQFTVTYTDGVEDKEIFADQVFTVNAYTENGGTKNAVTDFDPTATPTFEVPDRVGYTLTGWTPELAETVTGDVVYTAVWTANTYTVTFNTNGGTALDPITVTYDAAYGTLPTAPSLNGFTTPKNSWYLVDENGNVTDVKILKSTIVTTARDHELFQLRDIFVGVVKIEKSPEGIYAGTPYTLTATVANYNGDLLNYAYAWYKDGVLIEGATDSTLELAGNYSENGTYKVVVTATKKDGCTVITGNESASNEGSYTLKLNKIANTLRYNFNYGETPETHDSYWNPNTATVRQTAERVGYTFTGWNTKADGTGETYQNGDTITFPGDTGNGGDVLVLYAQWSANTYTVTFNTNGGEAIDPITVTFDAKYGRLPSSALTGFSGGDSNWYLVDENGNVTDTKITNRSIVATARDHQLFVVRKVLNPTLKITLEVPGAISNDYKYYVPGNSTRILTVTVNNMNADALDYTYQWYKDGTAIEGATEAVLTLPGNVSDSGTYKVVVTAKLKDGSTIVVTSDTASAEKEQKVQIMRAANTLRYNANYGETPATSDSYSGGASATVKGSFERTGYTFTGWNTKADGTGDAYANGDTVSFPGDNGNGGVVLELFAQWVGNTYELTLGANGGHFETEAPEGSDPVTTVTVPVTYGQPVGELPIPVLRGHTFAGWVDEQGNAVTPETIYSTVGDTKLTAQWTVNTYTITFDVTQWGTVDPEQITVTYGQPIGELPIPKLTFWRFANWDDPNGKMVTENTIYDYDHDIVLKAVWWSRDTSSPSTPQTGDQTTILVMSTMFLSAAGLIVLILADRKRRAVK